VQPVERVYRVWVVPVRGVGGMDAVVKPTWKYLRRPLTGTAQTYRSDERTTGYTLIKSGVKGTSGVSRPSWHCFERVCQGKQNLGFFDEKRNFES
jgi:hypothetical protein